MAPEGTIGKKPPSYQELLAQDSRTPPAVLRSESYHSLGDAPLSTERYTSQEFFNEEVKKLWPRVWQMACREEEVAEAGQHVVYEVVGRSVIIVRGEDGKIRGLVNSCLHRGRKLADANGTSGSFRCGFHGWTWSLDGSIKSVPCRWDFKHLSDADLQLPEVKIGTWGGFVFVNFDPDAIPLEEYLSVVPEHFTRWKLEDCYKAVHVAKVIKANWKAVQEAFMESYHVIATHPQILPVFSDANAQYDFYGDHVNRNLAAFGASSPHLAANPPSSGDVVRGMLALWGQDSTKAPANAGNARATLGDVGRESFQKAFGGDYSDVADAEVLDAFVYNVFPNFAPWGGFAPNIVYRWRPNGLDVNSCIMEVMILKRCKEGKPRPKPVDIHWLTDEQIWADAKEMPVLGPVIDQDVANLPFVQEGLIASGTRNVHLGSYAEIRIRHFHQTLDKYLSRA